MQSRVALAAALIFAAGCASEQPNSLAPATWSDDTGSGGASTGSTGSGPSAADAKAYFDANVSPILDDGTGNVCAMCHSAAYNQYPGAPHFLGSSPADYYNSLVANPTYVNASPGNSKLVTQGLHEGPAFSASQKQTVETWLQMEAAVRFGAGSGAGGASAGGATGEEMLKKFGDCMTLDDWKSTGMHMVANQPNSAKSNCYGCHNAGTAANYMADPADDAAVSDAFDHMRYPTPLTKLVTYEIDPVTGQFSKLVQAYRWRDKGQAPTLHPKYILDTTYADSMDKWFALTMQKCGFETGGAGGAGGAGGGGGGTP